MARARFQYKDSILTLLFMNYVSEEKADALFPSIDIPVEDCFADIVKQKSNKEIGDKLNKIIGKLAGAN